MYENILSQVTEHDKYQLIYERRKQLRSNKNLFGSISPLKRSLSANKYSTEQNLKKEQKEEIKKNKKLLFSEIKKEKEKENVLVKEDFLNKIKQEANVEIQENTLKQNIIEPEEK